MVHWWRRRWRLRAAGRGRLHFLRRRVTGARGGGWAFGRRHLPPRWRPRLAEGLHDGQLHGGGTKRAQAAAVMLRASAQPLGFGAWGGDATEAAAAGGME
jgi:hypothetical protein